MFYRYEFSVTIAGRGMARPVFILADCEARALARMRTMYPSSRWTLCGHTPVMPLRQPPVLAAASLENVAL